jgi:PhnB protein
MMQVYVKNSAEAFDFYKQAFGAREIGRYPNPDGTLAHSELDICGQVLAVSEQPEAETHTGNAMQFCLHFGEGSEAAVRAIHAALMDGASSVYGPEKVEWSPLMADITDKYGIRWCIFV